MSERFPLLSPELTAAYEPLRIIAHGSSATVIEARARDSGKRVAIKHIPSAGSGRQAFQEEVKHIFDLNHPNIVACLGVFSGEDDSSDLVFEFADGNLRELMKPGEGWPFERAWQVIVQVARGLTAAHARNIVHRDLKPENILRFGVGDSCTYKIADFGIARSTEMRQRMTTAIGSPVYMAPEQFYEEHGSECDIYALGVVLFELLAGRVPFTGAPAEIFRAHLEAPVPAAVLGGDSPGAWLVQRWMAKRPDRRPVIAEVVSQLESIGGRYRISSPSPAASGSGRVGAAPAKLGAADLFGDAFGPENDERPQPQVIEAKRDTLPAATDFFAAGFDEAETIEIKVRPVVALDSDGEIAVGHLRVKRRWSRAVNTSASRLVNLDDGGDLLVVTPEGFFELRNDASRGAELPIGDVRCVGTPMQGSLLLQAGSELCVLRDRRVTLPGWDLEADLDGIACSADLQSIVLRRDRSLHYHDGEGALRWQGEWSMVGGDLYASFDADQRLLVCGVSSDDPGMYVYDAHGEELLRFEMPGPIVAVSRCRFSSGCWAIALGPFGPELLRVSPDGILANASVDRPLTDILGGRGWIAGRAEDANLYLVDPATGETAALAFDGPVIGYEQGAEEDELYVLEQRGEILRYVSAFSVIQTG